MMRRILLSLLLLVGTAQAGIKTGRSGTLMECSSGCVTDTDPDDWVLTTPGPIVFIFTGTGTMSFYPQHSAHDGSVWVNMPAATGIPVTTFPGRFQISPNVGLIRWTVTCTGACTYSVKWHQGPGSLW